MSQISLIPTASASAFLIGGQVKQENPVHYPYLCKLEINLDNTGDEVSLCSGTLISPTEIVTAAHCLGRDTRPKITATCGNQDLGMSTQVNRPKEQYWIDDLHTRSDHDVAVLHVISGTNLSPLAPSHELAEFFNIDGTLKDKVNCMIAGFGNDNRGHQGNLNTLSTQGMNLAYEGGIITLRAISGFLTSSVDHGDSGGALICTDPNGNSKLAGVIGAYQYSGKDSNRVTNLFSAPWLALDELRQ